MSSSSSVQFRHKGVNAERSVIFVEYYMSLTKRAKMSPTEQAKAKGVKGNSDKEPKLHQMTECIYKFTCDIS